MRRVSTIALVHETLTRGLDETVDFDEVMSRGLLLIADLASRRGSATVVREGSFGTVGADDATALALVITELVTNAVEHGLHGAGGTVVVRAERGDDDELTATVTDDGQGLPSRFDPRSGLGLRIVQSLVEGELRGRITWERPADGGTSVTVQVRLRRPPEARAGSRSGSGARVAT